MTCSTDCGRRGGLHGPGSDPASCDRKNRWALQLAEQHDFIAGVVGWVDLQSGDCRPQLDEFVAHPKFVGIRHITQDEPDDDFIVSESVADGLAVLQEQSIPI